MEIINAHANSLKNQRPMQVATSLISFEMDTLTELYGSFNPTWKVEDILAPGDAPLVPLGDCEMP